MIMKLLSTLFICLTLLSASAQYEITNFTESDGLVNNVVNCVTVDRDDNIWFGTNRGISIFDGIGWTSITLADNVNLLDEIVTAIYARDNGDIWIGTDFGAGVWDGSSFTNYTTTAELGNLRVQAITEGNDGDIFFGTKGGFARLQANGTWSTIGMDEGLPFGGVKDIEVDESGNVWVGLGLEGMAIWNYQTETLTRIVEQLLLNGTVTGIAFSPDNVWVSSGGGVDQIMAPPGGGVADIVAHSSVFTLPPPHELNQAVDVQIDSKETVWAGIFIDYLVNVGGVSYYEDGVWFSITTEEGLVGPGVNKLAIDSNDCVWVATSTGVSKICAGPSSVGEISESAFKVYPNPVGEIVYIETSHAITEKLPVVLYDMQGQKIKQEIIMKGQSFLRIDARDISSGSYFLRIGDVTQVLIK